MSIQIQEAKRALGARLRDMRKDAQLSGRVLAELCGWQPSKVTRIEHGTRNPSEQDLAAWCTACDAAAALPDLVATLRGTESAYMEWRRQLATGLRRRQEASIPLYEGTKLFRIYQPALVPALFQTAEYAAAVMRKTRAFLELPDDVEAAVVARMERQRVLTSGERRVLVVLEEQVLRTNVGGPGVMSGQLDRLREVMGSQRVSLGVIPAGAERTVWPPEGFTVFDAGLARVETVSAQLSITQPREVALYGRTFERLQGSAVFGDAARRLLSQAGAAI